MGSLQQFANNMDWAGLVSMLISALAALFCITFHELSHGYVAYRLGDPTAKNAGRLSFNPIRHIDVVGLLMMITVHVGWAKPVPIDMRNFRNPKRDMAITSLAGPASNFLLACAALLVGSLLYRFGPGGTAEGYVLLVLMYIAVLSVGLGVFNLIPISPLDGSKVLLALLPDRICYRILRYEKYGMIVMIALVWLGVFNKPLNFLMDGAIKGLCVLTRFPYEMISYYFF